MKLHARFRTMHWVLAVAVAVLALPVHAQSKGPLPTSRPAVTEPARTLGVNSPAQQGDSVHDAPPAAVAPTCWNGALDYPTCTPTGNMGCPNGALDYPTCTAVSGSANSKKCINGAQDFPICSTFPPVGDSATQTCYNGAKNYPDCNSDQLPNAGVQPKCFNGATNYPDCTQLSRVVCENGAQDYPVCTPPLCANGAADYPYCTPPVCANGALDYPTCTPGLCVNGAIDYPTCTKQGCKNGAWDYPICTPPTCDNGHPNYPKCEDDNAELRITRCEGLHLVSRRLRDQFIMQVIWGAKECASIAPGSDVPQINPKAAN